jgi:hypothetical protein
MQPAQCPLEFGRQVRPGQFGAASLRHRTTLGTGAGVVVPPLRATISIAGWDGRGILSDGGKAIAGRLSAIYSIGRCPDLCCPIADRTPGYVYFYKSALDSHQSALSPGRTCVGGNRRRVQACHMVYCFTVITVMFRPRTEYSASQCARTLFRTSAEATLNDEIDVWLTF